RCEPGLTGARGAIDKHGDRLHWFITFLSKPVDMFFEQILRLRERSSFYDVRAVFIIEILAWNPRSFFRCISRVGSKSTGHALSLCCRVNGGVNNYSHGIWFSQW